jgi:hypothetical protein
MKFTILFTLALILLCACSMFGARRSATAPVAPPKPLTVQIGKNWKVIEEAPKLSDERGHLPAKMEPMQPEGSKSGSPEENRKIVTPP